MVLNYQYTEVAKISSYILSSQQQSSLEEYNCTHSYQLPSKIGCVHCNITTGNTFA